MEVHTDDDNLPVPADGTLPGRHGGTLTPFKKGESGNPAGMRKGTLHMSTILRALLNENVVANLNGTPVIMTRAEAMMLEKIRIALHSNKDAVKLRAIMDIEDRIDGRPVQTIPAAPDANGDGVVFYIPNENSRRRDK